MNFTSENFMSTTMITNADLTLEEVKDLFYDLTAFMTYKNNFNLYTNVDASLYYKNECTLYDAVYVRQFDFDELQELYTNREISLMVYGPAYNSLVYSAKSILIENIIGFIPFDKVKERYIINNLSEIQDIDVDKFIYYYRLYENCSITLK